MRLIGFAVITLTLAAACDNDTFTSGDASPDGNTQEDGQSGDACASFCSGAPDAALCADFDEGDSWSSLLGSFTGGTGSLGLTSTEAVSCSTSLQAVATGVVGGTADAALVTNHAFAGKTFTLNAQPHIVVELDIFLPMPTGSGAFFTIHPNGDGYSGVSIEATATNTYEFAARAGVGTLNQKPITPAIGAWTHFRLDATLGKDGQGTATLTYEPAGSNQAGQVVTLTDDSATDATITTASVNVGIGSLGPQWQKPCTVDYDNVVVTLP